MMTVVEERLSRTPSFDYVVFFENASAQELSVDINNLPIQLGVFFITQI